MRKRTEKSIMYSLLVFGLISLPITIWKHKDPKDLLIVFLLNSYTNIFVAPLLASKKVLQYPTRIFPNIYKSSIIYDYLLCALVSMWFVMATPKGKPALIFAKVWLFALPQALIERWLEKHSSLIKYRKGWTWIHSLVTISSAKLLIRGLISAVNFLQIKKNKLGSPVESNR